jgi:NAD(P)-dependent dehydrogenase (short-subunit alcohol dehydrogenase family)
MQKHEVVVITGASAGVGRATAQAFARRGAKIGLIARGRDGLEGAKRDVEALGGEALILPLDVSDAEALERAAAEVEKTFGPIDIWINNAMLSVFSPVMEMKPEEYKRVTEVTYLGYVYGTLAALKRMKPRDRGAIVQVGSALAYRGIPLQSAYCAAKHAIQGFHDSLRTELIHDGSRVRVVMVQLPAFNTPQFRWVKSRLPKKAQPVPPIFQPEVAAEAIVWAAYSGRREINVGWPTVKAVWGNNLVPGYADRYLAKNGYESQMTGAPEDPGRADNLWEPLPGDAGAHGVFDDVAIPRSIELELNKWRPWIFAGIAGLGAVWWINSRQRRGSRRPAERNSRPAAGRKTSRRAF